MLKSMTGYGKGEFHGVSNITVELKSINHRFLDLKIRGPRWTIALEDRIKNQLKKRIERGHVEIYINEDNVKGDNVKAALDEGLALNYLENLKKLKELMGTEEEIGLSHILRFPDVITLKENEQDMEALYAALDEALNFAIEENLRMRIKEGAAHREDMELRLQEIKDCVADFEMLAQAVVERQRAKLKEKIEKYCEGINLDETRLEQEMVYYIDRFDITEEITRLKSSIHQFEGLFDLEEPVGKRMDFLLQEMNREINTIGSKGNDTGISKSVVKAKTTLEKIREQVQNIE